MRPTDKWAWRDVVHPGLRSRTRLFLLIFAAALVLVAVHLARDRVSPLWALAGFLPGLALGAPLSRIEVLRWGSTEQTVVGETVAVGVAILVGYLAFLIVRNRIIDSGLHDAAAVGVVGLAMMAGAMLGRVYATLRGIRNILAAVGIRMVDRP